MKYLLLSLSLLIPSLSYADSVTPGLGLVIISTGVVDTTKNYGDKINDNMRVIAATITNINDRLNSGVLSIYNESTAIGNATTVNCVGANINCTQSGSTTTVTISGGASSGGDNFGSHVATRPVDMGRFAIKNTTAVHVSSSSVGALQIGTETTPTAFFHITSTPGETANQIRVSTGDTEIFTVSGNSVYIGTVPSVFIMGQLLNTPGSLARPGISFFNRPDTGMRWSGSLDLISAGVLRLELTSQYTRSGAQLVTTSAGSLTNPALEINVGSSQGFYSPNSNNLGFITQGVDRGRINSTGQWGLATGTSPIIANVMVSSVNAGPTTGAIFSVSTGTPNIPQIMFQVSRTSMTINIPGIPLGGALCINTANQLSKCTDAPNASGNCTCP